MEREIDRHVRVRPAVASRVAVQTKIDAWRKAWNKCHAVVQNVENLGNVHYLLERWIPILNRVFNRPIQRLEQDYKMTLYYVDEPNGPKEIIQIYVDDTPNPRRINHVFVLFNSDAFRKIHAAIIRNFGQKNNPFCFNAARGTIHMGVGGGENEYGGTESYEGGLGYRIRASNYHKRMLVCHLLFIYTLHAMAHFHVFSVRNNAHYDNHSYIAKSPFYKMYVYGVQSSS